ncbi:conserved hypothetical protein [Candidatus Desulfarcum epimagneticum]|uniref:Permuted papain-like amidase enzyme, YaeF/YiiX, C92 family n=1 Tax=uncultured Desulfobacteraceae bacterium TaxID=218296 RepID=A0A484HGF0_9BACT|nr:conserved hypothetical protein [uncultured Desulfobacteraceae bacterium]
MSVKPISYDEARKLMRPGDVIAFGGKGYFSEIVKFATFSNISHIGTIIQTRALGDEGDRFFNQIIESTSSNGVHISRFSDRLHEYDGELWWLPLSEGIRKNAFDPKAFFDFLFNQAREKKPYDFSQAVKSAIDALDELPFDRHGSAYNREDFSRFFCSELVAAGLEMAGAVKSVNASEVTPIDLCRWNIYEDHYYQLKGDAGKTISRFNTLSPEDWGE